MGLKLKHSTAQLKKAFVTANARGRYSHDEAHIVYLGISSMWVRVLYQQHIHPLVSMEMPLVYSLLVAY